MLGLIVRVMSDFVVSDCTSKKTKFEFFSFNLNRVATSISKIVKNLDNPSQLKEMLTELGQLHASHNVEPEYFEVCILAVLF